MGQYHSIYNRTKKECFRIGGAKLAEQAHEATAHALLLLLSNSNGRGGGDFCIYAAKRDPKTYKPLYSLDEKRKQKAIDQVSGRWAGDSIVVQGDYAKETDPGFIPESEHEDYKDITELLYAAIEADPMEESGKIVASERAWKQKMKAMV